jgi:HEPN domain
VLLDELESQGLDIPERVRQADQLSVFAVQARYPGFSTPVSQAEFEASLRLAEAVVAWAESFRSRP